MGQYRGHAAGDQHLWNRPGFLQAQTHFRKMNRKQLTILLVLVLVLGAAGLVLRNRQQASWQNANPAVGKKLLGNFPVNDVGHVMIKQGTNEVNLAKKDDYWRVRERNDYPAN